MSDFRINLARSYVQLLDVILQQRRYNERLDQDLNRIRVDQLELFDRFLSSQKIGKGKAKGASFPLDPGLVQTAFDVLSLAADHFSGKRKEEILKLIGDLRGRGITSSFAASIQEEPAHAIAQRFGSVDRVPTAGQVQFGIFPIDSPDIPKADRKMIDQILDRVWVLKERLTDTALHAPETFPSGLRLKGPDILVWMLTDLLEDTVSLFAIGQKKLAHARLQGLDLITGLLLANDQTAVRRWMNRFLPRIMTSNNNKIVAFFEASTTHLPVQDAGKIDLEVALKALARSNIPRPEIKPINIAASLLGPVSPFLAFESMALERGNHSIEGATDVFVAALSKESILPSGPVLIVGSGDGCEAFCLNLIPHYLNRDFTRIDALDASAVSINRLNRLSTRVPMTIPIHTIHADAAEHAYPLNEYARIVSISLTGFISEDKRAGMIQKIAHALKVGGKASIHFDLAQGKAFQRFQRESGSSGNQDTTQTVDGVSLTKHYFGEDEIRNLLAQAHVAAENGFSVSFQKKRSGDYVGMIVHIVNESEVFVANEEIKPAGSSVAQVVSDALLLDQPFVGAAGGIDGELERRTMPAVVQRAVYGGVKLVSGGGGPFVRLVGSDEAGGDVEENVATGKGKKRTGRGIQPKPFSSGAATFPLTGQARLPVILGR